jgi:hypothetical protein
MSGRPKLPTLFALGLVTACTLAFQVVLTRLFSAVLAYHFSFLAISLSLLGTGGGALLLYVRPEWFEDRSVERLLARWSSVFSLLLIAVPFILVQLDFSSVDELDLRFALNLAFSCLLCSLPSFASGVLVALAIDRYTRWIGPVYAFDLVGAGLGALVIVPILWLSPAPTLVVILGVLAGAASLLFAVSDDEATKERVLGLALAVAGLAVVGLSSVSSILYLDPRYTLPPNVRLVAERWTPLARVFGYEFTDSSKLALLFYDRVWAPVPIPRGDQVPTWKDVRTGPASVGYEITGPGRALVIGGGGGRDIYAALSAGQRPVDVIELIEGNRRVVDEDLGHVSGAPYSHDGVSTVIGDGRSVLAARDVKYDQIHIGFTDTLSANAAQGFALTENNLYTIEAFVEYLDHLKPDGVLNVSRLLKLVGDEALRITVLTLAALERYGVEDPMKNIVVILGKDVLGPPTGTVLARKRPYTEQELARIEQLVAERAEGLLFIPGGPYRDAWAELARAPSLQSFCEGYYLDVCPPTDDKPFFFSMQRLSNIGDRSSGYIYATDPFSILMLTLVILGVLSIVAFVVPLFLVQSERRPRLSSLTYFAAIGLGFLLLEIVLIQRLVLFLGFPTYALSVVLFALLIFSGIGSLLSSRFEHPRRALIVALALASLLIGAGAFALQPLLRMLIDLPFAARATAAVALLAPFGVTLGIAMPIGLRRISHLFPGAVPYAWGVNGVASVLASVLGMAIAINLGFAAATLAACACYVFALGHALFGHWKTTESSP